MVEIRCVECRRYPFEGARRWRAYLAVTELPNDEEVVVYCPACAMQEFGPNRIRPLLTWQPDERDLPRRRVSGYDDSAG